MSEQWTASVGRSLAAYENGSVVPSEIVEMLLRSIDRLDPLVGGFTQVSWDEALEEARAVSKPPYRGSKAGRFTGCLWP